MTRLRSIMTTHRTMQRVSFKTLKISIKVKLSKWLLIKLVKKTSRLNYLNYQMKPFARTGRARARPGGGFSGAGGASAATGSHRVRRLSRAAEIAAPGGRRAA